MKFNKTKIDGVYTIHLELRTDERGYFTRNFCKKELAGAGINYEIFQINRSLTLKKGTVRGMHFQKPPKEEVKIFQCLRGTIYYVAIDLRKDSETFGQWVGEDLSEDNKKMILVPKGCASGFQALLDNSEVQYWSSEFYSPKYESGVRFDDTFFAIRWPLPVVFVSNKDKNWPLIKN